MYRSIAALLAALCGVGVAQAQVAPSGENGAPLTLQRALELAGAASPSLDAAAAELRAAEAGRQVAGLRPNPAVTVEVENIAGSGPYRGFDGVEVTTALELPLELGGKRSARIGVANAQVRRSAIQAEAARADLRFDVVRSYAEAAAAERRLAAVREQARIATEASRAAEARVRAGRASPIETQRANVARINAEAEVERSDRLARVSLFSLARLIGSPLAGTLDADWFGRVENRQGPPASADSAGTLALAEADADVAAAAAGVRLARSQRIPDLTVSAGARRFEETGDTAALVGLSIPLPLFNTGRATLEQAASERQRADARRRMAVIEADRAIARARAELANAATTATTATGPALAAAAEAARIARIGYREGKFGQLDLLDAERTLAETRLAAIDALLSYHLAQAQLERLTARAPSTLGE